MKRVRSKMVLAAVATAWVAAVGAGLTGCSTPKPKSAEETAQANVADLNQTLRNTVKDAGRLQQMLALADQVAVDLKAGTLELASLQKEQAKLAADYKASRDDFRRLGDRMQTVRMESLAKGMRARQALAKLATDDEWKKITSRDLAILGN